MIVKSPSSYDSIAMGQIQHILMIPYHTLLNNIAQPKFFSTQRSQYIFYKSTATLYKIYTLSSILKSV